MTKPKFNLGDPVQKRGGDYQFPGWVQGIVFKRSGALRYVVEDDRGSLHIFSELNLELRKE